MASARFAQTVRQFSTSSLRNKLVKPPVLVFGIEGRYATALYSAASKQNKLEAVQKDLVAFKDLMAKDTALNGFIENPSLKRQQKQVVLDELAKKMNYSPLVANLFGALSENGRIQKLSGVITAFEKIMSAHRGEVFCTVTTAKPLDNVTLKDLKSTLQLFLKKNETLELELKVDPSIIGGMLVNIGDKYVDMSMASKIRTYTNMIKQSV